ncbi:MAG: hypothetical protein ACXIUZ_01590 [Lysobacteraceae bacterium]
MNRERIEATAAALLDAAREREIPLTADLRVAEKHAAELLGFAAAYLKQMRAEGKAPTAYGIGCHGARVSYRIADLAAFIEARREDW